MFDLLNALHELNNLTEDLLIERIDDVKKYYPNIPTEKFDELIALDPTFIQGKDKLGNYGKWILNLYKQNKLKEEDFYKVTDYLTKFNNKKNNFENKDIGQFKSLPDLAQALDNTGDVEKTDRQIRRDKTKSKEYDVVFEDDKWAIYVPKTYGASRVLGSGTHWCTASSDDRYYKEYTEEGPLYILISKSNPDEKYQFHFESKQFMDKYDDDILYDVQELINDKNVFRFFTKEIDIDNLPIEFMAFDELSKSDLDKYIDSEDDFVREEVARQGYGLDKLVNDKNYRVRRIVAEQGYALDKLVNDNMSDVRAEVALQGYGLDKLINDEVWFVRRAVAEQGYRLDKLINDEDCRVRAEVAEQGYALDKLLYDEDWEVIRTSRKWLDYHHMTIDKYNQILKDNNGDYSVFLEMNKEK